MERQKVISKITGLGKEITKDIRRHEAPKLKVPQRGFGNVIFDERRNILQLGDKKSTRSFLNIAHTKKFMQTILIASKCEEFVERNKTASIRELYYQLKHTIANTKENTFDDQSESVCPDEPLLVRIDGKLKILPGSEVIEYAEKTGKKIFDENGKVRITDVDLKVCAFDSEQKIKEHKVLMVMKHPSKQVRRIKTSSGREVKVTPYHSLFTLDDGEVKSIEVDKLGIGSYVALPRRIRINPNDEPINVVELLIKNAPDSILNKIYLKGERTIIDKILKRIGKEKLKMFSERYKNVWSDMTANWKHWETIPISVVKETSASINDLLDELKISCTGSRHNYNTIIRRDENLGIVLGYLISEGSHAALDRKRNERHIAISNKSQELLSEFISAFNSTFGDRTASPKPIKSKDGIYKLNLGYNLLGYVLEYVFDYGPVHAWEKEVPSVILDAPEECIKGFLRSFRLGDGSVFYKKLRIRYHTTSTSLVNGIVFLLLRLGIFPNIYHYKRDKPGHHDAYEIRVGSREYVKMLSEITSDFSDMNLERKSSMSGDRIPNIGKLINDMRRTCSKLKEKDYRRFDWDGIENKKRTIGRTTLENIVKTLQPYNPDPRYSNVLNELVNGDIYWDKVVGIEEAEVPPYTLDLAVNPTQNFIGGNGLVILHNSDPLIVDLETMLGVLREELHLKADDKGTIVGNIVIEDSGDLIDCSKLGRSGLAIPSIVEHYKFRKVKADYVLVIETGAMFDRLVEEKYHLKNNCIMVSTKGQAARGCRRLVHRLHNELKLPTIMFTDGDPWGYYIYSVMKAGSMALAHESRRLGTPGIRFVGMTMTDVEEYGLQKVTEKLKDLDKKRINELLQYPWFQKREWKKQLDLMQKMGVRIEQQALASKSLEFVAEEYLPEKIKSKDLLP